RRGAGASGRQGHRAREGRGGRRRGGRRVGRPEAAGAAGGLGHGAPMPETSAVAIVGAGAVGSYFGGMLARGGVPVTLIGRRPHVEAIARDGLRIDGDGFRYRIPVAASTDIAAARGADIVLLTVKTPATEDAARDL